MTWQIRAKESVNFPAHLKKIGGRDAVKEKSGTI